LTHCVNGWVSLCIATNIAAACCPGPGRCALRRLVLVPPEQVSPESVLRARLACRIVATTSSSLACHGIQRLALHRARGWIVQGVMRRTSKSRSLHSFHNSPKPTTTTNNVNAGKGEGMRGEGIRRTAALRRGTARGPSYAFLSF
jgi:hypothetical protein